MDKASWLHGQHATQPTEVSVRVRTMIACCPVDISTLPVIEGYTPPVPTDEHTIGTCHRCPVEVWVGPKQRQLADDGHLLLCYLCMLADVGQSRVVIVDPDQIR